MRLFEFLDEAIVGGRIIDGVEISYNGHVYDRAPGRGVSAEELTALIKRIPDVKNKFKPFGDNQMFYIWSKSMQKGIGLRRRVREGDKNIRVDVMTAIDKVPFHNDYAPAFQVG